VVAGTGTGTEATKDLLYHAARKRPLAHRAAKSLHFPPKAVSDFHRHPGDQWNTVEEGEITLTIKGEAPRTLKAGDTGYIPRGTVHRSQNLSDKPARVIELNIMDKDKPDIERVSE
jgi:quercetin dioxygenase-like cupin family protein